MTGLDATHDPAFRSWVPGADGHADFPIQNLPFGVFSPLRAPARSGVAIGVAGGTLIAADGRWAGLLHAAADCAVHLPCTIGGARD